MYHTELLYHIIIYHSNSWINSIHTILMINLTIRSDINLNKNNLEIRKFDFQFLLWVRFSVLLPRKGLNNTIIMEAYGNYLHDVFYLCAGIVPLQLARCTDMPRVQCCVPQVMCSYHHTVPAL